MLASAIVDWAALWKIAVAGFVAGAGLVAVYGVGVLGVVRARGVGGAEAEPRPAWWGVVLVAGLLCLALIAVGVYAMTQKS